jgi:hypothetical protein
MKIEFSPFMEQALLFPPEPIKKVLPNWFKEADISAKGHKYNPTAKEMQINPNTQAGTVKKCIPATDYMTSGYVLKNFIDIKLTQENIAGKEEVYFFHNTRIGKPFIDRHAPGQFPGIPDTKQLLKISGVWSIKTPPGYSCLFYQPFYNLENRWEFLPAIVDTDSYTNAISFPFLLSDIPEDTSREIFIPAGEPLVCVFPFKRDEWTADIKTEVPKKDKSRTIMMTQLEAVYRRFFHTKKKYN